MLRILRMSFVVGVLASLAAGCVSQQRQPQQTLAHWSPERYYAAHVDSVMVLVQDKSGRHERDGGLFDRIDRRFSEELIDKGYGVVNRDKVDAIIREMKFGQSGLTTDTGAAQLGKMANASAVLVVTINHSVSETHSETGTVTQNQIVGYDKKGRPIYRAVQHQETEQVSSAGGGVSAKVISIETATEIWTASQGSTSQGTRDASGPIEECAVAVANALPKKDKPLPTPPTTAEVAQTTVDN